ncbi:MAG: hypothetical protein MOB07_29695 [Acidobacteria bacterium]|nr:hypothetical protein [Acidobacteriota bacterium]
MKDVTTLNLGVQRDIVGDALKEAQERIKDFIGKTHVAAKAAWCVVGAFIFGAVFFTGWHNWNLFARGADTDFGKGVAIIPALLLDGSLVLLLVLLLTYFKDSKQWAVAVAFNALLFLIIGVNTSLDYSINADEPLGEWMRAYLRWGVAWTFLGTLALWEIVIHLDPTHRMRMRKAKLEMMAQSSSNEAELQRIKLQLKGLTDDLEYHGTLQTKMHDARMKAVGGDYVERALVDYEEAASVAEARRIRSASPKA